VPCRNEHPELLAFNEEQTKLSDGVELFTVVNDDSDDAIAAFFAKNGGDWPKIRDPEGAIAVAFGVAKVPETWVVDPSGFVRLRIAGEVTSDFLTMKISELKETLSG
jgi:cytochrome c biogenesis protein CcmG/thiol:disulfide interchange protein DsbE